MKAIRIHEFGGPEVLTYEECPSPSPGAGQVRVDIQAVGVNYSDIYIRSGRSRYNFPLHFPMTLGVEAAGVVSALGDGVTEVEVGDAVAYGGLELMGSYAEQAVVPADRLIKLPARADARLSAAVLLQGMTAHVLTHNTYTLKPGDAALIHAGAGGTGRLLIQMAKRLGAYVFATVSTDEKAALARAVGADRAIIYTREDFEEEVKKTSDGQGVQVVYDAVGKTTFDKSLNCLARGGYLVLYGEASGPVPPVEPWRLVTNSVYLTRPGLAHFIATREELVQCAHEVLDGVISGQLQVHIDRTLPLADAFAAHSALERRETAGKVLLVP